MVNKVHWLQWQTIHEKITTTIKSFLKKFTFIGKLYSRFLFYKCKENDIFKDKSKWNLSIQNITHGIPFSGDSTPSVGLSHLMKFTASTDKGVVMTTADMREPQHKQHEVCIDVCLITNTIHMTKKSLLIISAVPKIEPQSPYKVCQIFITPSICKLVILLFSLISHFLWKGNIYWNMFPLPGPPKIHASSSSYPNAALLTLPYDPSGRHMDRAHWSLCDSAYKMGFSIWQPSSGWKVNFDVILLNLYYKRYNIYFKS